MPEFSAVGSNLPAPAERALRQAGLDWDDEAKAEGHIRAALEIAPDHPAVRLGAYKFYFYRHRLAEALPHAQACLAHGAAKLGLGEDWKQVRPNDAPFSEIDGDARYYLFSLMACGYLQVRLGQTDLGKAILAKVSELDPADALGAASLLRHLDKTDEENE